MSTVYWVYWIIMEAGGGLIRFFLDETIVATIMIIYRDLCKVIARSEATWQSPLFSIS